MNYIVRDGLHGTYISKDKAAADWNFLSAICLIQELGYKVSGRGNKRTYQPQEGDWADTVEVFKATDAELPEIIQSSFYVEYI